MSVVEGGVDVGRAPKPACWSGWTGNFLGAAAAVSAGGGAAEEGGIVVGRLWLVRTQVWYCALYFVRLYYYNGVERDGYVMREDIQ